MTTQKAPSTIELGPDELAKLHRAQLQIARRVKTVCDTHDLDYFLIAGTLLGAVRHGGFIPWDDDMDIGMPRDSYDRFLEIAAQELGPDYFVQTLRTDPGYGLCFAKIRLDGTELNELAAANTRAHSGIYIDVFPFDNVPDNKALQVLHAITTSAIKRLLLMRQGYEPWLASGRRERHADRFILTASKFFSISALRSSMNWVMRLANRRETSAVTAIGGSYGYKRERIDRHQTVRLNEVLFEGTAFKCLNDPPKYLSRLYGNYMKLPPLEERMSRHSIVKLVFQEHND